MIEFVKRRKDDKNSVVRFALQPIQVNPDEEITVRYIYFMAKEEEDTEIFQTLYPSAGINITIHDNSPNKRRVKAKSIHRNSLTEKNFADQTGTYVFSLDDYVLSRQGYAIWWKNIPIRDKK